MNTPTEPAIPLHVMYAVDKLGVNPSSVRIDADTDTCTALAAYLDVLTVDSLHAVLTVRRWRKHGAIVEGNVAADITQQCVVTLEPVPVHVREEITARFLPVEMLEPVKDTGKEIVIDPVGDDPPETFDGRNIDLGALVLEYTALGIDPYPRAVGACVPERFTAPGATPTERPNPFQILAKLQDKPDD